MPISLDEVRHVARLARLDLDETEMFALQGELNSLLMHFADLQGADVKDVEPMTHPVAVRNVWSEDAAGPTLPRETALRNAALQRAGLFVVPQINED